MSTSGGLLSSLIAFLPFVSRRPASVARKVDVVTSPSARPSDALPRQILTEDEAREKYPGFEHFVEGDGGPGEADAFVSWCVARGTLEFHGFAKVWAAYELFCAEGNLTPYSERQFQRRFSSYAERSRVNTKGDAARQIKYKIRSAVVVELRAA